MRIVSFITAALLGFSVLGHAGESASPEASQDIVVYRSPSCGCCGKWLEHLRRNQFTVVDKLVENVQAIKNQYGVTPELASCHTALVGGYVVEGHVPANDIRKLLTAKSAVVGITVPGMPVGTPGMEMGTTKDAYQVLSFDSKKQTQVFSEYGAN